MTFNWNLRQMNVVIRSVVILALLFAGGTSLAVLHGWSPVQARSATSADGPTQPWTRAQTIEPADLLKQLATEKKPTVVCVGVHALYRAGHVPSASLHGPASSAAGLADLQAWAQPLPRSSDIVVYCGCCPLANCPNLKPAFTTLLDMGFTHVKVLELPHTFATDWVAKGYPVERE
jgi:thiosulfate/3-mercaptopyruvate sulfurtransferase